MPDVDSNEAEHIYSVINAHDQSEDITTNEHDPQSSCDAKRSVGGATDCETRCDWSRPSVGETVDDCDRVKFYHEEMSRGIEADDERGASSSSDDDWQEVEGWCQFTLCYHCVSVVQ